MRAIPFKVIITSGFLCLAFCAPPSNAQGLGSTSAVGAPAAPQNMDMMEAMTQGNRWYQSTWWIKPAR